VRKLVFLTTLGLFLYGCQTGGRPDSIEKSTQKTSPEKSSYSPVLTIAGETITIDDIVLDAKELLMIPLSSDYERFKQEIEPELKVIITNRILNNLLYQEAKKNTREDIDKVLESPAEAKVRKFIAGFGGDYAEAEKVLKQRGMDWAEFKKYQKKIILIDYYLDSLLPKPEPITYSDISAAYNQMKEEFFVVLAEIKYQLVDIEPVWLQVKDPNQDRPEYARILADELLQQLEAGKDFLELAKEYRTPGVTFRVPPKPVPPESLVEPYHVIATEADKLEPGDISGPIETTDKNQQKHILIIKLEEKRPKGYELLEKVQRQVEAKIISDRRKQSEEKIMAGFKQQAENELNDEFTEFCLQKIYETRNELKSGN
jgi:hypothetical protein